MAKSDNALLLEIQVGQERVNRELARLTKRFVGAAKQSEKAWVDTNARLVRTTKRSGFAVANLSAQINDVGVSLLGGQSPFQVAIQQGTQITQIFQQAGGNVKEFAELAKGALAGVLNPFSLATFAIIAAGGALVQWLGRSEEEAKKSAPAIERLTTAISDYIKAADDAVQPSDKLAEKYGLLADKAKQLLEANEKLTRLKAIRVLNEEVQALRGTFSGYFEAFDKLVKSLDTLAKYGNTDPTAKLGSVFYERKVADEVRKLGEELGITEKQAIDLSYAMREVANASTVTEQAAALREMDSIMVDIVSSTKNVNDKLEKTSEEIHNAATQATDLEAKASNLPAVFAAAANAASDITAALSAANNAALRLLNSQSRALAIAKLNRKYRGDPVGLAGAKAGLEFDTTIKPAGNSLAQAALKDRRKAIVDLAKQTAQIIEENKKWLAAQRKSRGGGGRKSRGGGGGGKSTADGIREEIAALNAKREALQSVSPAMNDYGFALDFANTKQKLLNEARRRGVDLTPEQIASIDQLATAHARASAALKEATEAQKNQQKAMADFKNTAKSSLKGFIDDLIAGKSATEALHGALNKLADKLLDSAFNSLFDGIFSPKKGGGLFGSIGKLFGFEGGGIAAHGLPRYSSGGVSKTAAIFGEAGPEAAVPLPDGRRIPVDLRMGKGRPTSVNVTNNITYVLDGAMDSKRVKAEIEATTRRSADATKQSVKRSLVGWLNQYDQDGAMV